MDELKARENEIAQLLQALPAAWSLLMPEVERELANQVESLVAEENPEIRGRIKALRWIKELPDLLRSEQVGISASLSEQDEA